MGAVAWRNLTRSFTLVPILALAACPRNERQSPPPTAALQPGPVRITQFYVAPPNPPRGEKAMLCYGVDNASSVRLEPDIERLWPAMSRCFQIVPTKPVTYTLIAERGAEHVSQSLTVNPGAPPVRIIEVSINKLQVKPEELVMVCYKVKNAASVTIQPGVWVSRDAGFGCVQDRPKRTTTYLVTATGADGATDTERVTAQVK
jgi:hypothetical protein